MENENLDQQANQIRLENLSQLCANLSSKSIEMVEQRYQSLLSTSSHLMTCISIVFVALFSLLPILISQCSALIPVIAIGYFVIFAFLTAALITTLIARYRFQYSIIKSPQELVDYTVQNKDEFDNEIEIGQFFGRCLEEPYRSLQDRNDRISRFTKVSFILLILCLALSYFFFVIIALVNALCF